MKSQILLILMIAILVLSGIPVHAENVELENQSEQGGFMPEDEPSGDTAEANLFIDISPHDEKNGWVLWILNQQTFEPENSLSAKSVKITLPKGITTYILDPYRGNTGHVEASVETQWYSYEKNVIRAIHPVNDVITLPPSNNSYGAGYYLLPEKKGTYTIKYESENGSGTIEMKVTAVPSGQVTIHQADKIYDYGKSYTDSGEYRFSEVSGTGLIDYTKGDISKLPYGYIQYDPNTVDIAYTVEIPNKANSRSFGSRMGTNPSGVQGKALIIDVLTINPTTTQRDSMTEIPMQPIALGAASILTAFVIITPRKLKVQINEDKTGLVTAKRTGGTYKEVFAEIVVDGETHFISLKKGEIKAIDTIRSFTKAEISVVKAPIKRKGSDTMREVRNYSKQTVIAKGVTK